MKALLALLRALLTPRTAPGAPPAAKPAAAAASQTTVWTGRMSVFGGPADTGVTPSEGLALLTDAHLTSHAAYFLPAQPAGTSGLARRLDPDSDYIACRWDYDATPKDFLRKTKVVVEANGRQSAAQPVDWGPHARTGRVADLSPGLARKLGLKTDDTCTVIVPLPAAITPAPIATPSAPKPKSETPWVEAAAADIGLQEITGPKTEPRLLAALDWADGVKDGKTLQGIRDDETPWCSSWLCAVFERVGIVSPRSAWAQSWAAWKDGVKLAGPAVGCVVVFRWSASSGHVAIVVGKSASGALMVLGGNQANAVNVKPFGTAQVLAYMWPKGFPLPAKTGLASLPVTSQDKVVTSFKDTR